MDLESASFMGVINFHMPNIFRPTFPTVFTFLGAFCLAPFSLSICLMSRRLTTPVLYAPPTPIPLF